MKKKISYYLKLVITLSIFSTSILIIENIIPKISANEESVNIEGTFNQSEESNGSVAKEENPEDSISGSVAKEENSEDSISGSVAKEENSEDSISGSVAKEEDLEDSISGSVAKEEDLEDSIDESTEVVSLDVLEGYLSNVEKQKIKNESHSANSFSATEVYGGVAYVKSEDEFIVMKNENNEEFTISNFEVLQILENNDDRTKIKYNGEVGFVNTKDLVFNHVVSLPYYEVIENQVFFYEVINPEIETENNYFPKEYFLKNSNLEEGVKYYSFDNLENYFPLSSLKKIPLNSNEKEFVKPEITSISLDDSKSYFRNLSFRSKTNYTAAELDIYVEAMQNRYHGLPDNGSCYFRTSKSALLYNARTGERLSSVGAVLKEAERKYGVNAMFILAMANHESCFGFSGYATSRNNFWGFMAYDSNPDAAAGFKTRDEGIYSFAKFLSNAYTDYTFTTYAGTHAGASPSGPNAEGICVFDNDNESGVGTFWATGCEWQEAVSKELSNIDSYLGAKDVNQKSMASIPFNSTFYKTPNGEVAYSVTRAGRENINLSLMVLKEVGDYYEVQPDTPIDANKNAILSDRWVITSPVNFNSPNGLIYRTDETNYDIRNTNNMFYYYKRTTGNIFGEYDNVVDNNRTLYIKKNIVKAIYGNQVIPKPETSKKTIEANFKAAGLYQDLVVFDVTAFYKDDQGKMQNLPSAPDVYLDIDDNHYNGNEVFAVKGVTENYLSPEGIKVYSLRIPKSKLASMKNYRLILGVEGFNFGKVSSDTSRTTLVNTTFPTYGTVDVRNINQTVEFSFNEYNDQKNFTVDYVNTGVYNDFLIMDMVILHYYENNKYEELLNPADIYIDTDDNFNSGNEIYVNKTKFIGYQENTNLPMYSIQIPKNKLKDTQNYRVFARTKGYVDRKLFTSKPTKNHGGAQQNYGNVDVRNIQNAIQFSYNNANTKKRITSDFVAAGVYENSLIIDMISLHYYESGKWEELLKTQSIYLDTDTNFNSGNEKLLGQLKYLGLQPNTKLPLYSIEIPKSSLIDSQKYKIFVRAEGYLDRQLYVNGNKPAVTNPLFPNYGTMTLFTVDKFLDFSFSLPKNLKTLTADYVNSGIYNDLIIFDMLALEYINYPNWIMLPVAPQIFLDVDDIDDNGNEIYMNVAKHFGRQNGTGFPMYSLQLSKKLMNRQTKYRVVLKTVGYKTRNIYNGKPTFNIINFSNLNYGSAKVESINNSLYFTYN